MDYSKRIAGADHKKGYAHFDSRVTYLQVQKLVENPDFVSQHAFYPLIATKLSKRFYRVTEDSYPGKSVEEKDRDIAYAAHLDHRIYQYYSLLWSDLYEKMLKESPLNECVMAYRSGKGLSNISAAAKAIEKMRELENVAVLTSDFRHFFPSIDHSYLTQRMRELFSRNVMPEDHFKVLRSVLHYSLWPLDEILTIRGYDISSQRKRELAIKQLNRSEAHALTIEQFSKYKEKCCKAPWKTKMNGREGGGVPQGLAVSGVLSNIYMFDFDCRAASSVKLVGGSYMRYCDDFIVVVPWENIDTIRRVLEFTDQIPGVHLHESKTRLFHIYNGAVQRLNIDGTPYTGNGSSSKITFLGFDFDGKEVRLRAGTIGKFFNRYYRRIKAIKRRGKIKSKQRSALYRSFTQKGNCPRAELRNFLSYVSRAQKMFPNDPIAKPFSHMYRKIKLDLLDLT